MDQRVEANPDGVPVIADSPPGPAGSTTNIAVHVGFALIGVATTLLGPLLPLLALRWHLSDAQAGTLFTAQFAGSIGGALLSGPIAARFGYRTTLVAGFVAVCAGISALAFASAPAALAAVFCNGIGLGFTIPTSNMFVAAVARKRPASALSLLNFAWGIGAVACPWLAIAMHSSLSPRGFLLTVAAGAGAMALWLAFMTFPQSSAESFSAAKPRHAGTRIGKFVSLATLFFLYVGTEASLVGWIAAYTQRSDTPGSLAWLAMPSLFWAPFLAGRGLAPLVMRRLNETTVVRGGLLAGAIGITLLLSAPTVVGIAIGIALAGIGFAAIFPLLVALIPQRLGNDTRLAAPMFAIGGLGGAFLPWFVGALSTRFGTLQAGLLATLIATLCILGVYVVAIIEQPIARTRNLN
jgi:FHS family glucose/mannose:H+ symporter-like MFS transporter